MAVWPFRRSPRHSRGPSALWVLVLLSVMAAGLLREILGEAAVAGKAVRIHVERNNPALGLYHRLGFQEIDDQGVYLLMQWAPARDGKPSAPSS